MVVVAHRATICREVQVLGIPEDTGSSASLPSCMTLEALFMLDAGFRWPVVGFPFQYRVVLGVARLQIKLLQRGV